MTTEDPAASTSVPSIPAPAPPALAALPLKQNGRFLGSEGAFFGLLARGNVWMLFTLGIYRFWLTTDIRRFLWDNTEIAGDTLEYTGTAKELLIGFLLAIVLLLPINALIYVGTLVPSILPYAGTAGFIFLALLGQFAFFRARRYRLTRTILRGIRFHQTGSAVRYALLSSLWFVGIMLSLGLLYPWASAYLERYKIRKTYFGDLQAQFVGSGTSFFYRGILLWLIVVAPILFGLVALISALDPVVFTEMTKADDIEVFFEQLGVRFPGFTLALGGFALAAVWSAVFAAILFPVFKAIEMRWWVSGIRFGAITATSKLRAGQLYWVYIRFLLLSAVYSTVFGMFAALFGGLFYELGKNLPENAQWIGGVGVAIVGYIIFMLGYAALYQATVTIRIWRLTFEMTEFDNLSALDNVKAAGAKSGVFGEGLADALDMGGF